MRQESKPTSADPETVWDHVRGAATDSEMLNELLQSYRPIMVAHLVYKRRIDHDFAEDVVQEFVQNKILEKDLLEKANPERGRFRSLLKTALDRFFIDKTRGKKEKATPVEPELFDRQPERTGDADAFDAAWAMNLLAESFQRTKSQCEKKNRPEHWGVFEGRILAHVYGFAPTPYEQLAQRLGFASPKHAANALVSVQLMLGRNLASLIGKYHSDELQTELNDLQNILRRAGPKLLESLRQSLCVTLPDVTASFSASSKLDTEEMARVLGLGAKAVKAKQADNLRSTLEFVMTTPLQLDISQWDISPDTDHSGSMNANGMLERSLAEVLFEQPPNLDLLVAVKNFAKEQRKDSDSPMPREISTLIYYIAIAAAYARLGRQITKHDPVALRQGFQWGMDVDWIDEQCRGFFATALESLDDSEHQTGL